MEYDSITERNLQIQIPWGLFQRTAKFNRKKKTRYIAKGNLTGLTGAEADLRTEPPLLTDRDRLVKIQVAVNQDKAVIRVGVSVMI
jgi:hypothetical protein